MNSKNIATFKGLGLSDELTSVVHELGYTEPTPIQKAGIPVILNGQDLIAQSKTGSGKTAAFSLPILQHITLDRKRDSQALILCPTRELCTQVAREVRKLGRRMRGLQVLVLSGGVPIIPQIQALERGVHILVGTPGRVLDLLLRGKLNLSKVKKIVLDEADRMLEMGFQEDMTSIFSYVPLKRQTLLFSATYPVEIEAISRAYQVNPTRVSIEMDPLRDGVDRAEIEHFYYEVEKSSRGEVLGQILQDINPESAIVFCNFKASVSQVAQELKQWGISVDELHGDLEQRDRDRVMAKFRNRSLRVLVATDVAARGIDVSGLDLVINYELPKQPELYVHRVGRTGRAGASGIAISIILREEKNRIANIELEMNEGAATPTRIKMRLASELKPFESDLHERGILQSSMKTLYLGAGRTDKLRPGDILGALTGEAGGLNAKDIGKIEIHDRFSYVAISASHADRVLASLRTGRIKGRKLRVEPVR